MRFSAIDSQGAVAVMILAWLSQVALLCASLNFPTFLQPVVDFVYSPNGLCWSLFCFCFSFHPSVFGSKTLHFTMAAGLIGTKWTDVHISGCSP